MSLLASQALITNEELRTRVEAAIRKTAAARVSWAAPAGTLAQVAVRTPDVAVPAVMLRLATNTEVVAAACDSCGHAGDVSDETIEWVVGDAWDAIATDLFGSPDGGEPTT